MQQVLDFRQTVDLLIYLMTNELQSIGKCIQKLESFLNFFFLVLFRIDKKRTLCATVSAHLLEIFSGQIYTIPAQIDIISKI